MHRPTAGGGTPSEHFGRIPFASNSPARSYRPAAPFCSKLPLDGSSLRLTGSASSLGLVLAAGGLPSLILGPWGGSIADRDNLRKLLIVTQSIFGVLAIALWILASEGSTSVRVIVAINMIGGFV